MFHTRYLLKCKCLDATNQEEWDTAKSGPAVFESPMPFIDHWKVSQPSISLRDIIKEEQALQDNMEKV